MTDDHMDFLAWALIPTLDHAAAKWSWDFGGDLPKYSPPGPYFRQKVERCGASHGPASGRE